MVKFNRFVPMSALVALLMSAPTASAALPAFPEEYSAVVSLKLPYIPLDMPIRILSSAEAQRVEYFDGLQVDYLSATKLYRSCFNNSVRICIAKDAGAGPTARGLDLGDKPFQGMKFFPDLSTYKEDGEELVGGTLCKKFSFSEKRGTNGLMDDKISFYWDPVLKKPVRWKMHAREVTFESHTDEYILDFIDFQPRKPSDAELVPPEGCQAAKEAPKETLKVLQIESFLSAMHRTKAPNHDDMLSFFAEQHGKSDSQTKLSRRQRIFAENLALVEKLNAEHGKKTSFRGNKFMGMTKAEFLSIRGGKTKARREHRRSSEHQKYVKLHQSGPVDNLPKNFDWRTERPGVVSPVKDQGMCGSCWTYGATEPIESALAIQTGKELVELPEQFFVDCTWTNGTGVNESSNLGCDGGDSDRGALEVVRKFGGVIPTAASYGSYLSTNGYCKDISKMDVGAKITGWVDIPWKKGNEAELMHALVTKGPLSIGIMVPDELKYYDGGVVNITSCKQDPDQIDHAVTLTGYGTDEHGQDYWWVRNSWSTYWGDKGYFRVARGEQ
eukprot:TRINITY_DN8405_c1_g1_i1.p1 TRINITY_DN8405_c1_g1~~TRINITY_DN8405_c1_g1_i1.p1  ORF type:complete len:555 (+),score=90.77 TRINITY_DN8405_c1_g1_i1:63-1727(+)